MWNPAALRSPEVIVTEGIIDALTWWQHGFRHVTTAYSAKALPEELLAALLAAKVKRVFLSFDRDPSGDEGTAAAAAQLTAHGVECLRVMFPPGLDANAYALKVTRHRDGAPGQRKERPDDPEGRTGVRLGAPVRRRGPAVARPYAGRRHGVFDELGDTVRGGPAHPVVRDTVNEAEVGKTGACHLFRHTMATLMLENGADVRFIQQQLGHAELSTTQIYTQVSIRMLKEVHTRTHPAATLSPEARAEIEAELTEEEDELADGDGSL